MLLFGAISILIFLFIVTRVLVIYGERWRLNAKSHGGSRRFLKPKTWFQLRPKHLFKAQGSLLTSRGVREFYAPAAHYIEERQPKRLYLRNAWLSPYYAAVKTTVDQNGPAIRGKHMQARKQIRQVAKWAEVKPLPEDVFIGGDQTKHCLVELGLDSHRRPDVEKLIEDVKSALHAQSIEFRQTEQYDRISMLVHWVKPEDILIERKFGVEFFNENPALTPYSIPLAIQENGQPWSLGFHHTLVYGMTGAGKGGPIQGTIRQLAPFVEKGTVKFYGIDPKGPELGAYAKKGVRMFERISIGLAEENIRQHAKTINQIARLLSEREASLEPDFTPGQENLNRDIPATKETPWIVLFIDEYLTLIKGLKKLGKEGTMVQATLEQILATGRSFGIYVFLATQVATKEVFGDVRDNVPNAIVLKHKAGNYWTTEFLGEDALENGHNPKAIGASNKANGYRTAGIGYVSSAEGIVKVRFGYLSDADIVEVARRFMDEDADLSVFKEPTPYFDPADYGLGLTQEEADELDGLLDDEDDDGDFTFSVEPTRERDELQKTLDSYRKKGDSSDE
ncbi:FtsK/SpoIIIE domain-containing protein [Rathayibacter rathayi]|uniref:FtsK/SpoIIIE domain-containing protein n=1 Tax=Rathayibacter rathayi TaxID=33887 RepID=UPI0015E2500F|nr:FtsK/SpoIIIE domain-containing protein [Rathayibacter rathayi]